MERRGAGDLWQGTRARYVGLGLMAVLYGSAVASLSWGAGPAGAAPRRSAAVVRVVSQAQPAARAAAGAGGELALSLQEAVQLALQRNLDITSEGFGPSIARAVVAQERAVFDPSVGLITSVAETKVLPTTEFTRGVQDPETGELIFERSQSISRDSELTPVLRQRLVLGGEYELRFRNTRLDVKSTSTSEFSRLIADPRHESSLELSFIQPLLRNFGIAVNTAPIQRAERSAEIARQQLLQTILDVVFRAQNAYWELSFQIHNLQTRQAALKLAQDFLTDNKERVRLGVLAPVELVQAETQVKNREGDVIVAEAAVRDAEDNLKQVLNIPGSIGSWQSRVRPSDEPPFEPFASLDVEEQIARALEERPDLISARLDIEIRQIARSEARNQLLPRLDLVFEGGLNAFGGRVHSSLSRLTDVEGYNWRAGLQVEYPLGNRAARNLLHQRTLESQRALVDQHRLELDIVRQVRQTVRSVLTAIQRVEVTKQSTVLAQTQLEAEQKKFSLGLSTSFEVLTFQNDLTDARNAERRAIIDYNIELARLDQQTARLRSGGAAPQ